MVFEVSPLKHLEWDSQHFSKRIGQYVSANPDLAEVEEGLRVAREQDYDCVYLLLPAEGACSAFGAAELGFNRVGERIEYRLEMKAGGGWQSSGVRRHKPEDVAVFEEIAARSHHDSRFYRDEKLRGPLADELYRIWIRRSCQGWAAAVFAAEDDSGVTGYCTCHLDESGEGRIGLIAVAERARGKGIGMSLVQGAMKFFASEQVRVVSVVTQGANDSARRLYERIGFELASTSTWLHYWSEEKL
jgi:dTDP-4-amino-4,6-dideoxy-D-galactose acyltransferase